mgnify:FL=1|tara:strand:+ start:43 stop:384 length:342 start_codon:yes stop_codon:yes gene_type:complete
MSILDRAKSHFENIGVQSIEVPEWKDEDGKPTVLFWNPINLYEKNKLFKKSDNMTDVSILADIVVMKSLDKDGKKIFKLEDKMDLLTKVDSDVLSRIATAMIQVVSPDEVKKN